MAHVIKDTVEQLPVLIIQFIKQWFCIYIKICKALTVLKESKISGQTSLSCEKSRDSVKAGSC